MPLALVGYAQQAINSGANGVSGGFAASTLPLRNLSIEVRQINQAQASQSDISARGTVRLRPGQPGATASVNARQDQQTNNASSVQQILVLNGRRASVGLHNSMPFRLVQAFVQNGVLTIVPGTVLLESGTGFDATARWEGGEMVELELAAAQGQGTVMSPTVATATSLLVPVGEWITVAHSDTQGNGQNATLGSSGRWSNQSQVQVQLRVNLR